MLLLDWGFSLRVDSGLRSRYTSSPLRTPSSQVRRRAGAACGMNNLLFRLQGMPDVDPEGG